MHKEKKAAFATRVEEIFRRFHAHEPEPKTELDYTNEFTMLIAIVLSAQMTDAGVNKATPALFAAAPTPQKMVALGVDKVRELIKSINFNNGKARNVIALSQMLIDEYDGKIPHTAEELQRLPGVGRKTANVWMNNILGARVIAVDTHVFRVANRLALCKTTTADDTAEALARVIPDHWKRHAHHWLILHGRYICVARKPKCYNCIICDLCPYEPKTML